MTEKRLKKPKSEKMKSKKRKNHDLAETLTLESQHPRKNEKSCKRDSKKRRPGPRLPSSILKELDLANPNPRTSDSDGESESEAGDVYEYEEAVPEEESKKNRRFDPVENYEYELPDDFQDEDVPSDDDEEAPSEGSEDGEEDDRHSKMLEGITGIPSQAFDGKENKKVVLSDFQGDLGDGGKLSINDLLDPLHGKKGYSKLRKRMHQLERQPMAIHAPLPKVERERLERKVAYEHTRKDITKWEPLVKRNREAPTLYFEEDVDVGFSTVGAIASEFEPRTEFEKKMASLVRDPEVAEAHWKDGSRLLELNKVSVEDVKERHNRLAKMRSLLFRHEMKAKHIKKIKSKTYHRLLKKDKQKKTSAELEMDPEAVEDRARKQELKRAEEHLTLKHKLKSRWSKRVVKRGLEVQHEGTRAAISEQLQQHALLTRKQNTMKVSSSSDESSDDDPDELSAGEDSDRTSKLLNRAKEKTIKVIDEEDEMPKSGVLALPFMERGLKKQKEAALEEARLALQEYNSSLGQLRDAEAEECSKLDKASGRKVFGPVRKELQQPNRKRESENDKTDSEDDFEVTEHDNGCEVRTETKEIKNGSGFHQDESEMGQETVFKNFDDIIKDPGPKTTYEVAIFASGSWKKMKGENELDTSAKKTVAVENPVQNSQDIKAMEHNSDSDSDEGMVDGMFSSGAKSDYELPSQAELLRQAFASDDVEAEFEKDKMEILNEENPEPEKPVLLPGWGQWTHVQRKRGMPSWMVDEHEKAKRKREQALKQRKDAKLKNVIISEKIDKKAEKLHAKTLPYPFTSKEVYEQSIRMPIGPDYNPAISIGALNRPAVVKKAGMIIKPIKYKEVDPYGKEQDTQQTRQKPKEKRSSKPHGRKAPKKA